MLKLFVPRFHNLILLGFKIYIFDPLAYYSILAIETIVHFKKVLYENKLQFGQKIYGPLHDCIYKYVIVGQL